MADSKTLKALELALHHATGDAEAEQAFRVARMNIKKNGLTFSDFVKEKEAEPEHAPQWTGWAGPKEQAAPKPRKPRAKKEPKAKPAAKSAAKHAAKSAAKPAAKSAAKPADPVPKYGEVWGYAYNKKIYSKKTALSDAIARIEASGDDDEIFDYSDKKHWMFSAEEFDLPEEHHIKVFGEDNDVIAVYFKKYDA